MIFRIFTIIFIIGGLFWMGSFFVLAYSDSVTHPDLSAQTGSLHNYLNPDRTLTREQIGFLAEGSYNEDIPPRFVNHFYDPTTGSGWGAEKASHFADKDFIRGVGERLQRVLATSKDPIPSTQWIMDRNAQGVLYADYGGDNTWWRALDYALDDDWDNAYKTLGNVLHLVQDASVPAHARDDSHAGGDLFESWAFSYSTDNERKLSVAQDIVDTGVAVPRFSSPDGAIKWVAEYSNANFFSDSTILNGYEHPVIREVRDNYAYGFIGDEEVLLAFIAHNARENKLKETLDNPIVMSAYWERLSKRAVLGAAGVIDLFHREVERMQRMGERPTPAPEYDPIGFMRACLSTGLHAILNAERCAEKNTSIAAPFLKLKRRAEDGLRFFGGLLKTITGTNLLPAVGNTNDGVKNVVIKEIVSPLSVDDDLSLEPEYVAEEIENEEVARLPIEENKNNIVARIFDGDTVQLFSGRVVRYLSIDTPEVEHNNGDEAECLANEARERNRQLVDGKRVKLVQNEGEKTDKYGRLLAYVFLEDGTFVNEILLREGLAKTLLIPPRGPLDSLLEEVEVLAKQEKVGIWGSACELFVEKKVGVAVHPDDLLPKTTSGGPSGSGGLGEQSQEAGAVEAIEKDTTLPIAIDDLAVELGSFIARWTVRDDVEDISFYEIRISSDGGLTEEVWNESTLLATVVASGSEGFLMEYIVDDFDPAGEAELFVAIRAYDDVGNGSPISNNVLLEFDYTADYLVISEVQVEGRKGVRDEFVELYNPTDSPVDLGGWKLTRLTSGGTEHNLVSQLSGIVPSFGYFLIAHPNNYFGHPEADMVFSGSSATFTIAPNNVVILYNASGQEVDRIEFGNSGPGESFERKVNNDSTATTLNEGVDRWAGNAWDSNTDEDFIIQTIPNPQNSTALYEPRLSPPLLADSPVPAWQVDARRSGWISDVFGPMFVLSSPSVDWSFLYDSGPLYAAMTVNEDDNLVVISPNGVLKLLDISSGIEINSVNLADLESSLNDFTSAIIVADGRYYVMGYGAGSFTLLALDEELSEVWSYRGSVEGSGEILLLPSGDVVAVNDKVVRAIDPNGSLRRIILQMSLLRGAAWNDGIYAVTRQSDLFYYDEDGVLLNNTRISGLLTPPAFDKNGGVVFGSYLGHGSGSIYRYNNDIRDWRSSLGDSVLPPVLDDEKVVMVGSGGGEVKAFDIIDGSLLWSFTDFGSDFGTPMIDANGIVYVGSESGFVFALGDDENDDGRADVLWSLDLGKPIVRRAPPVLANDGTLIVATSLSPGFTIHAIIE